MASSSIAITRLSCPADCHHAPGFSRHIFHDLVSLWAKLPVNTKSPGEDRHAKGRWVIVQTGRSAAAAVHSNRRRKVKRRRVSKSVDSGEESGDDMELVDEGPGGSLQARADQEQPSMDERSGVTADEQRQSVHPLEIAASSSGSSRKAPLATKERQIKKTQDEVEFNKCNADRGSLSNKAKPAQVRKTRSMKPGEKAQRRTQRSSLVETPKHKQVETRGVEPGTLGQNGAVATDGPVQEPDECARRKSQADSTEKATTAYQVLEAVSAGQLVLVASSAALERASAAGLASQTGENVEYESSQADSPLADMASKAAASIAEGVNQVAESVTGTVSDGVAAVAESMGEGASLVMDTVQEAAENVTEVLQGVTEKVRDVVPDAVVDSVATFGDAVSSTVDNVVEGVGAFGDAVAESLGFDDEDIGDEFDVFENTGNDSQFTGKRGLYNYRVLEDKPGPLHSVYNAYVSVLKLDPIPFSLCVASAPVFLSLFFTFFYTFDLQGISWAGEPPSTSNIDSAPVESPQVGLSSDWMSIFYIFTFSLSLATGLQPSLEPKTPYTLLLANLNALVAQLLFVFLSGAVFARLSQPARPIKCSDVALVSPPVTTARGRAGTSSVNRVLVMRYALAGPQPCELVDVKVDLVFKYNTRTRTGSYFRSAVALKLVRSEVAYQWTGMLVRHIIDQNSPLWGRTEMEMQAEDAIFTLSVVGLEKSSMQTVFHVQHYSVVDGDVVWGAEFEDMFLISNKNVRVIDHSKLSKWKRVESTMSRRQPVM